MKRTPKSINQKDFIKDFDEFEKERRFRELWRFCYTNRHVIQTMYSKGILDDEFSKTRYWVDYTFSKYQPQKTNEQESKQQYQLEFTNCLIYAHHKKWIKDGYVDLRYEALLNTYDNPLGKLNSEELETVKYLHELTYQYGYLITVLYAEPDSEILWETLINSSFERILSAKVPEFFQYPKKGEQLKGVQMSLAKNNSENPINWDLAVFLKLEDKVSHLKKSLNQLWKQKNKQIIGDCNDYHIALYVDRKECKKTYVLNILELQIAHLKPRKSPSNTVDAFRISEELTEKRWNIRKNYIRRSIGLVLWDRINTPGSKRVSKKALIKSTIDTLRTHDCKILDVYHSNFYKPIEKSSNMVLGDTIEVQETVIREMEADYALTNLSIEKYKYLSPSEAKNIGKLY